MKTKRIEIVERIETAKQTGCFSAQADATSWAAYTPDGLIGLGRTELDAWRDLFHDIDYGNGIVAVIEFGGEK